MNNPVNIGNVVADWTWHEHRRLHGPYDSKFSYLSLVRPALELSSEDSRNFVIQKSDNHIYRLLTRVDGLADGVVDEDFAAIYMSDALKVIAGWQAREHIADATDQPDFRRKLIWKPYRNKIADQMASVEAGLAGSKSVFGEADKLLVTYKDQIETYSTCLETGKNWGNSESAAVVIAQAGQIATIRYVAILVDHLADTFGGVECVPLKNPAKHANEAPIVYPFVSK